MLRLFFIALGGAAGTLLRYIASGIDYRFSNGVFPVSTLVVNLAGSLVIGFLWGIFERLAVAPTVRMFIFIGILGGFTTFSTFSLENFNLIRDGEFKIAVINILASNIIGIALVFAGFAAARFLMANLKGVA
ncbi:MAG: fluoride efflux transporter CrcB [Candidatus Omnitrophica bacterium]|nr:fluoride efflux transporter CrcB [Candidatus Omnitrophota bacterium]